MEKVEPVMLEKQFEVDELFFSTTDNRGVIEAANDVFIRLSGYQLDELIGAAHSIIRHPDMPRSVFKLLWDTISAGESIVAYVKNMAADGSFYWVLALVVPMQDRYLSIRLKPTSELFPAVKDLYRQMRSIELDKGDRGDGRKLGMEASQKFLLDKLQELGFNSYQEFMHFALREEISSRDNLIAADSSLRSKVADFVQSGSVIAQVEQVAEVCQLLNNVYSTVDSYSVINKKILDHSKFLTGLSSGLSLIAINSSIEAARLGNDGRALSVVAQHLKSSSNGVSDIASSLLKSIDKISSDLIKSIYYIASARLQSEMLYKYVVELASNEQVSELQNLTMFKDLKFVVSSSLEVVGVTVTGIITQVSSLLELNNGLSKSVISLQFAQVTGAVESSRLDNGPNNGDSFKIIFNEVKEKLENAREELQELADLIRTLNMNVLTVPKSVAAASNRLNFYP